MGKIKVQQTEGEIVVAYGGPDTARTYKVTDAQVTVAAADVPAFLAAVEGSSPGDPAAEKAAEAGTTDAPAVSPTS